MSNKNPLAALLQTFAEAARLVKDIEEDEDLGTIFNGNFNSGNGPTDIRAYNSNDGFSEYEEVYLDGNRNIRRYPNGTVRLQNTDSGVVQEERPDGSLLISLPNGKVLYQRMGGESVLVMDTNSNYAPGLAQVSQVNLPGEDEPALMFHFQDRNGTHLIELDTLRYFRAPVGAR